MVTDAERLVRAIAAGDGAVEALRLEGLRANGVPFLLDVSARVLPHDRERRVLCTLRDVNREGLVEEARLIFDAAFDKAPIGMALFNTDGEYVHVNPALCEILRRSERELLGTRDQLLTHPDDRQRDLEIAARIFEGEIDTWKTEKRFLRPDGEVVWTLANLTFVRDEAGRGISWLGQFQDVTSRRAHQRRLQELAHRDPLTGLYNRRRFEEELDRQIRLAGRAEAEGALLILDVDRFKLINDRLGHGAGDGVLTDVAEAMRARLRSTDVLARLGGDEFAAILVDIGRDDAATVAEQVVAGIRELSPPEGYGQRVSASVGVASFGPGSASSAVDLLSAADRAMYSAKADGRDRAHTAETE